MSAEQLALNLTNVSRKIEQQQFIDALRLIRDTKLLDLNNVYLSGLEHFVSQLTSEISEEHKRVITYLIARSNGDYHVRTEEQSREMTEEYEYTLAIEKLKNSLFQNADVSLGKKEYQRALEDVRRIFLFDPHNIVAKQYEKKISELSHRTQHEQT